jgi:hypothetical protein
MKNKDLRESQSCSVFTLDKIYGQLLYRVFSLHLNEMKPVVVWKTGTTTLQAKRVFDEEHFWGAMPPCTSCYEGNIFHA